MVVVMDTETLEILRTEELDLRATAVTETSAKLSADGGTLYVGTGGSDSVLYAIDTTTLQVAHRWPLGGDLSGLGLSLDGMRLYAALGDHLAVLDPATGLELGAVSFTSPGPIVQVSALGG
jgi:YVTN family beta-propeller protein